MYAEFHEELIKEIFNLLSYASDELLASYAFAH